MNEMGTICAASAGWMEEMGERDRERDRERVCERLGEREMEKE